MNLYIEVQDRQAVNHPALESNLLDAFKKIPDNWEPFVRVPRPEVGVYQVLESDESVYAKVDGVWTDVWPLRDMTPEEKAIKQQAVRDEFNARQQAANWSAWTLDEATCKMVPPIPRPEIDQTKIDAGILTVWCGAENGWKDTPARPQGLYKFDFFAWQWVEITQ
jgi:hypothetical protein